MKLLFVFKSYEWLGIEYLSAVLKKYRHQTSLAFEPGLGGTFYFDFLKKKNNHNTILRKVNTIQPDLILFSSTTNLYPWVTEVAAEIKKHFNIPTLAGGIHATIQPNEVIKSKYIDMICVGEGEEAIVELANKMDNHQDYFDTKNIWFKKDQEIIRNDVRPLIHDLDLLPYPDKELFMPYGCITDRMYIIASRWCPYDCSYCFNHQIKNLYRDKGFRHLRRSVDSIIDELRFYKEKYQIRSVHFYDDTFNLNDRWLFEFCQKYKRSIDLPFYCLLKPDLLNKDSARALKDAGCECVAIGLESGNYDIRKNILKRDLTDECIIEAAQTLKANRIKLITFNMFCLPGETPQQMLDTVDLNLYIKPNHIFSYTFYPFPGTTLMRESIRQNLIDNSILDRIIRGEGNYTAQSILRHPYRDLGYNLKIILPLLNKLPKIFQSYFLKYWIYKKHSDLLLSFLKILLIPLYSSWEAKARIKEQISMFIARLSIPFKRLK